MLEQIIYLNITLEEMDISPVKLYAVLQRLCLVKGKLGKVQNVLEEKHTTLKSCDADTLAINEDNLSDNRSHVRYEYAVILRQKADDLHRLMSLIKEKLSQSIQDEQIQILPLIPESWNITKVDMKFPCFTSYMIQQSRKLMKEKELLCNARF